MSACILVVDDELSMREFLAILLEREGYLTTVADCADAALRLLATQEFDLIISDVSMPGLDGIGLLERVKQISPATEVLIVTAFSTTEQAVEVMKQGAYDYIAKPFKVEELKALVRKALDKQRLSRENTRLKKQVAASREYCGLIGSGSRMQEIFSLIDKIAASPATVLIQGESGTGKELVAKAIHSNSQRASQPFVAVNCSAIPETLMESEFFGHARGSFTGAFADRPGLFEQADAGTLFLDEIGEIPLLLQAKLLRVLQEREVRRVGSSQNRRIDVRIIAATNQRLEAQVAAGLFREDLFYRLNVVQICIPPLRERPEDIPLLVDHFISKYTGAPVVKPVESRALKALLLYPFPGNVRELENVVERATALGHGELTLEALPSHLVTNASSVREDRGLELPDEGFDLEQHLNAIEQHYIIAALKRTGGVRKRAATLLGMTFRSFRYKLAKHGLEPD
jgi:two-component system response regulator PilR (NtrC family)